MKSGANVVIVENDLNLAEKLSLDLGNLGYKITGIFRCPLDAAAIIESGTPDAILLENRLKDQIKDIESLIAEKESPIIYFYKPQIEENLPDLVPNYLSNNKEMLKKEIKESFKRLTRKSIRKKGNKELGILSDRIFVKHKDSIVRVSLADIYYIEADRNYCRIFTRQRQYLLVTTLKEVNEKLPESSFLRIHRSYIVNLAYVDEIGGNHVVISSHTLPLSKNMRLELFRHLQVI